MIMRSEYLAAGRLHFNQSPMGKEMDMLVRQIAMKLSVKRGERYCDTVGFVRRRIRFDLLRTCVISLRGYKKTAAPESIRDLDLNLRPVAY